QPGAANPGRAALALRQLRTVDRFHDAVPLKLRVDSSSSAILRAAPGVGSLRQRNVVFPRAHAAWAVSAGDGHYVLISRGSSLKGSRPPAVGGVVQALR